MLPREHFAQITFCTWRAWKHCHCLQQNISWSIYTRTDGVFQEHTFKYYRQTPDENNIPKNFFTFSIQGTQLTSEQTPFLFISLESWTLQFPKQKLLTKTRKKIQRVLRRVFSWFAETPLNSSYWTALSRPFQIACTGIVIIATGCWMHLLTSSMSFSRRPISSGRETSLLFAARSTSSDCSWQMKGGMVDSWFRLKAKRRSLKHWLLPNQNTTIFTTTVLLWDLEITGQVGRISTAGKTIYWHFHVTPGKGEHKSISGSVGRRLLFLSELIWVSRREQILDDVRNRSIAMSITINTQMPPMSANLEIRAAIIQNWQSGSIPLNNETLRFGRFISFICCLSY